MPEDRNPQHPRLIGALLRVPYFAVVERVHAGLVATGFDDLRPAYLTVFQHIDAETGSRLTELAELALMTKQSMGYLVDYLERQGYVERVPDPTDGRARLIRLTGRGAEVMRTARQIVRGIEAEWAGLLGQHRMDQLRETLHDLVAHLEALSQPDSKTTRNGVPLFPIRLDARTVTPEQVNQLRDEAHSPVRKGL